MGSQIDLSSLQVVLRVQLRDSDGDGRPPAPARTGPAPARSFHSPAPKAKVSSWFG